MMTTLLSIQDFDTSDSASFLYTLSAAYLDHNRTDRRRGNVRLNDEQHTLTALCYLDSQIQEGGFVQLIASGYGRVHLWQPGCRQSAPLAHQTDTENLRQSQSPV